MAGGIRQLSTYGLDDGYLTEMPEITHFKGVYRRYTNFAIENKRIDIEDKFEFGKNIEITIPIVGDCINKIYLEIELPELDITYHDVGLVPPIVDYDDSIELDYKSILKFMELNMNAYRRGIEEYYPMNTTSKEMLIEIRNIFASSIIDGGNNEFINVEDTYIDIINRDITSNKIRNCITNLNDISNRYLDNSNELKMNISKEDIKQLMDMAIFNSKEYQQYYFTRYNNYKKNYEYETSENLEVSWSKRLGHIIIDYIDLYIAGQKIDRHYGIYYDIFYELAGNKSLEKTYMKMIGDINELTKFDRNIKQKYKIQIPLQFWFCNNIGLSLPIIAMNNSQVDLKIRLNDIKNCLYTTELSYSLQTDDYLYDIWENKGYNLSGALLIDYVFLDQFERIKFAQSAHEYLVTIYEDYEIRHIPARADNMLYTEDIRLNGASKEIIWIFQKEAYYNKDVIVLPQSYNYGMNDDTTGSIMKSCNIEILGDERVAKYPYEYYNYYNQYNHHRNIPKDGIYCYSFSLYPDETQPSGTCNFNKLKNIHMNFEFNPDAFIIKYLEEDGNENRIETNLRFLLINKKINVLRIQGGYAGLGFM